MQPNPTPRPVGRPATGQGDMLYLPRWFLPHARAILAAVKGKDYEAAMGAIAAMTDEVEKLFTTKEN
jgi:hypothetical protein